MKILLLFFVHFTLIFISSAYAQTDHRKTDLRLLNGYIDSIVAVEMNAFNVPGATVVIVQDSQDVFVKGYGLADVEAEKIVDPKSTGFRIASVTKTFTATAIMQLSERGLIDLHAPISQYLPDDDFTFLKDKPFTAHQLLTHTAGIDLTDIGDAALEAEDIVPLEEFVRNHIPNQVNPPGMVHSYSNFGYTILGYLIQEISGLSYEEFIRQNILLPLRMTMSSMSQPLQEPFKSNLSKSYKWDNGQISIPRDYTNTVPGGGLIATGDDMSRYLLMHLNGGSFDSTEILSPISHRLLTSQQYGSEDTKYGVCYSFFENGWTGRRTIDHTGAQLGFLSLFLLIPETGTGLFIAQNNRENGGAFRFNVAQTILDTLLTRKERHLDLPKQAGQLSSIAKNYTGRYQQMNYPHSSFEKLGTLVGFSNSAYVVQYEDDSLLTLNGEKFVMIDKERFHRNDESSPWNIQFVLDENGRAQRIIAGITSYQRTPWFESKKVWQRLIAGALLLTIIHLLRSSILWIGRKISKSGSNAADRYPVDNWLNWTGGLLILGLVGISTNLAIYGGQLADYGVPLSFKLPLILNTLGAILALYAPIAFVRILQSDLVPTNKIFSTLLTLAILVLAVGYWKFNIVGFQFG